MGITMFLQMKVNPEPADPVQKQVFTWMPVLFTFTLGTFASGLVIYWSWNNILVGHSTDDNHEAGRSQN